MLIFFIALFFLLALMSSEVVFGWVVGMFEVEKYEGNWKVTASSWWDKSLV